MDAELPPPSPGRIKRQVTGRSWTFATVCPPGLEDQCLAEAAELGLAGLPRSVDDGVFEWTGRLADLHRALLFSRVASRVLVRLDRFHAGAREELFRKAYAFPWELWLAPGCRLRVDAHVQRSRISHEGQCAQTLREAIERRMRAAGLAPPVPDVRDPAVPGAAGDAAADIEASDAAADDETAAGDAAAESGGDSPPDCQRLIVRLVDNQASLSLDAAGEHLHRRGWRFGAGLAPLRENLAAGLLRAAGWPGPTRLVDGMCGSGTFAIEAAGMAGGGPCGALRRFACQAWPCHDAAGFERRRGRAAGTSTSVEAAPAAGPWTVLANELDPAILAMARANAERAGRGADGVAWRNGDFFDLEPPEGGGLLVLNPPYGIRLSDGQGSLYPRLALRLAQAWRGWNVLLLGPEGSLPRSLRPVWTRRFRHGGLVVCAWCLAP